MPALGLKLRIQALTSKIASVVTTGLQMWHKMTASTWTGSNRLPDSSPVATNTAALYTGRGLDFDGVNDYVDVGNANVTCKSIVLYVNPATTTESILQLTASIDVNISAGTLTGTGWTSPTEYVDGVASDTVSASAWQQIAITSATGFTVNDLDFGRISSTYYDGAMSNVKIFSVELSAAQIAELYANPEQVLPTGVVAAELVGWWPMGEGTAASFNYGQSGLYGSLNGATNIASIPSSNKQTGLTSFSNVLEFTSSNYITFSGVSAPSTISMVVNALFHGSYGGRTLYKAGWVYIQLWSNSSIRIYSNSSSFAYFTTPSTLIEGEYYQFVFTQTGTSAKLYVNGSLGDTKTLGVIDTTSNTSFAGRGYVGDTSTKGVIFEAGYFNTELSATEVTAIWNNGNALDLRSDGGNYASSANLVSYYKNTGAANSDWIDLAGSNNGSVTGTPATLRLYEKSDGYDIGGYTMRHTNTGELILHGDGYAKVTDAASLDITDELTLEAWVKPFDVSANQAIIAKDGAYALKINNAAKLTFSKWTGASLGSSTSTTAIASDVWTHVAITYDGANVRFYLNGSLDLTTAVTGAIDTNSNDVLIGALTAATENFDGYIDSAKIYSGTIKTDAEILENYNAEKAAHS